MLSFIHWGFQTIQSHKRNRVIAKNWFLIEQRSCLAKNWTIPKKFTVHCFVMHDLNPVVGNHAVECIYKNEVFGLVIYLRRYIYQEQRRTLSRKILNPWVTAKQARRWSAQRQTTWEEKRNQYVLYFETIVKNVLEIIGNKVTKWPRLKQYSCYKKQQFVGYIK